MDFTLIRTFLAVADHQGFAAAADSLGTVQSNVTHRITKLEQQFDQQIFTRGRGGAQLTPFGEVMQARLRPLLEEINSVHNSLQELARGSGILRLGAMETTTSGRFPKLLKALRIRCPDAKISLTTGSTAQLTRSVWARELDAAFVAGSVDEDRFKSTPAFSEILATVSNGPFSFDAPLVTFPMGCHYRATTESWLRSCGKSDFEVMEMGTFDGIMGAVAAEIGFTVAPIHAIERSRETEVMEVAKLPKPYDASQTSLIMRHDYQPARSALQLIDILTELPTE